MANLYVRYYKRMGRDEQGNLVPVGEEPAEGGMKITYTTAKLSGAFPKYVRFIRMVADADAYIAFGTTPTATASESLKLEADVAEYFALNPNEVRAGTLKLSVYDGSS